MQTKEKNIWSALLHRATINQQHVIIRARCTRQLNVYLVTWTFQSSQNYLYKLSGKRLVRETSDTQAGDSWRWVVLGRGSMLQSNYFKEF